MVVDGESGVKIIIASLMLFLTWASNPTNRCDGGEPPLTDVAFSPDGSSVVACSQAGVQIFNWPELTMRQLIKVDADNLHDLRFSRDGTQLAIAAGIPSEQGIAVVYSWPDVQVVARFVHEGDSFLSVGWIDQSQLVIGCADRTVIQWDFVIGKVVRSLAGHSKAVTSVGVLGRSDALVTAGFDHSLRVWNSETGELIRSLNQHTQPVRDVALKPAVTGLPMLASASSDRTIRFWQPTIGRMVRYIRLDTEPLKLAWINDSYLASACVDGTVQIIDVANVTVAKRFEVLSGWAYALAVHPSTRDLVVAGESGQIERIPFAELPGEPSVP